MKFLKTPSAPTNKLNQAFFEWWATLESNQACVSARELQLLARLPLDCPLNTVTYPTKRS